MTNITIAVVGATGMVGVTFLKILEEKKLSVNKYRLFSSARSAGKKIMFMGSEHVVEELTENSFNGTGEDKIDIALFSAGGDTSKKFAPIAAKSGCVVIDNSSCWRMDENVPLVVPEVNPSDIEYSKGIIANPNCSTIQAVVALKPLDEKYRIKRIIYSTYQAVSGAGVGGWNDLEETIKGNPPSKFPFAIAGNCIPHIDVFTDNGYTKEELKMIEETRKILNRPDLRITATTVRVPVFSAHSESINVEFENSFELSELIETLKNSKGIVVQNDVTDKQNPYPMPLTATSRDEVFVGRIRRDESVENGINLWVVADNVRKGAALNAIQIAELVLNKMQNKN